jgi:tetratricopeptide (TPR) repeat protein
LNVVIALINNRQFGLPHILRLIYGKQGDDHTFSPSEAANQHHYDFQFHLCRGITMYHLGDYDNAIRDFGTALRINWRDENVVQWLGKAERARKDTRSQAEALQKMDHALVQQGHVHHPITVRN